MPRDSILDEKSKKGSAYRFPSEEGSKASDIFLFGQSMLIISDLMTTQLLLVHEVDPIRRYLPSATRPKSGGRYSSFEVSIFKSWNNANLSPQTPLYSSFEVGKVLE